MLRRRVAAASSAMTVVLCALVIVVGSALPASASCAAPLGVADAITHADVVVVGTVTATRSRDRIATVAVDETWKGDVVAQFELYGGPSQDNAVTSVDRTYQTGVRYLLFAFEPGAHASPGTFGGRYEDNACSATRPWEESLSAFRPATTTVTAPSSPSPTSIPSPRVDGHDRNIAWITAAAVAVVVAAGLVTLVPYRRRHRRAPATT